MHAAHGIAENQPQMFDAQALGDETVMSQHHVIIIIAWEFGTQPIGWF